MSPPALRSVQPSQSAWRKLLRSHCGPTALRAGETAGQRASKVTRRSTARTATRAFRLRSCLERPSEPLVRALKLRTCLESAKSSCGPAAVRAPQRFAGANRFQDFRHTHRVTSSGVHRRRGCSRSPRLSPDEHPRLTVCGVHRRRSVHVHPGVHALNTPAAGLREGGRRNGPLTTPEKNRHPRRPGRPNRQSPRRWTRAAPIKPTLG
jgi:hypothetical protein